MSRKFPIAFIALSALAISGCAKTLDGVGVEVRSSNNLYQPPASTSIANDIKGILVAGGLDVVAPSAPTNETKVAEMANGSSKDLKEAERLVAKLENSPLISTPAVPETAVAQNEKIDEATTAVAMALAPQSPTTATAPTRRVVQSFEPEISTVTIKYPEIGVAALEPVPEGEVQPKPTVESAKPSKSSRIQVAQVAPKPVDRPTKPKRF